MHSSFKVLPQHFKQIGLLFRFSAVPWVHCPVLTSGSRILWYAGKFMVFSMTRRCSGPVAPKQAQILTPPPPCLIVNVRCLC